MTKKSSAAITWPKGGELTKEWVTNLASTMEANTHTGPDHPANLRGTVGIGQRGIAQPCRNDFVPTTKCVQQSLKRETLLGTSFSMPAHIIQFRGSSSAEKSDDLIDVLGKVCIQFGQDLRIARVGIGRDLIPDRLLQCGQGGIPAVVQGADDARHHAVRAQGIDGRRARIQF